MAFRGKDLLKSHTVKLHGRLMVNLLLSISYLFPLRSRKMSCESFTFFDDHARRLSHTLRDHRELLSLSPRYSISPTPTPAPAPRLLLSLPLSVPLLLPLPLPLPRPLPLPLHSHSHSQSLTQNHPRGITAVFFSDMKRSHDIFRRCD